MHRQVIEPVIILTLREGEKDNEDYPRNLHELGGTVGGLIAVTWKPDLSKCLLTINTI